jgi:signal transduction histidine kinase
VAKLLRVLFVEDSEDDAHLLLRELQHSEYEIEYERVETRAAMKQALLNEEWDIILCDYNLPQFNAMIALETLKESGLDIPFLVVSGTIEEESAVTALKAGAHDFIVKGRFARLVPAMEREMAEAEIRRSYREAEARQANLTANLEAISAELERFLYTAFHELKSPLVTIKGFLGLLSEDLQANRSDQVNKDIERIAGAVDKLKDLLSDLLTLSRIGRVIHPHQEVDLFQLTQETVHMLDESILPKSVSISISPDLPTVYGDPIRLREVLENLIENAAKHLGSQKSPLIEIGTREQEGQKVIFVRDNGRGIDPRYHNRIFNLFEKLDLTTEGSGVGLAIVKRIIEVHGGKIWVESEGEQKGSTFCFTLPDHRSQ